MEIHTQTVAIRTVDEMGVDKVRLSLRALTQEGQSVVPMSPVLYTIDVDKPDAPYVPGEELTIVVSRNA